MTKERIIRWAVVVLGLCGVTLAAETNARAASLENTRHIQYSFTLQNNSGELASSAEFWTYAPAKHTPTQTRLNLKTIPACQILTDKTGNEVLYFVFKSLPPYAVKIITIEADLALRDTPESSEAPDPRYVRAEPLVEIDDPDFVRLAPSFAGGGAETARNIFEWVRSYLKDEGYAPHDRGALYALKYGKGDCTEFMCLFVALCRLNGIPARGVAGYMAERNAIVKAGDYHNWAEFYQQGAWRLADPQVGHFMTNAERYVALRIMGENDGPMRDYPRFRYSGGKGLKVVMN